MTQPARFERKADFSHVYNQSDPRAYFTALQPLDYQIPHHAQPIFRQLSDELRVGSGGVLDLCCSYGVNAALLTHDLELADLFAHYTDRALAELSTDALAEADRGWYAARRRSPGPRTLGMDAAGNAVAYARDVGLLDDGWCSDLETTEVPDDLDGAAEAVRLVTITGGVGYVTERTFGRLLAVLPSDPRPTIAAFVLRTYPYDTIATLLDELGYATEHLDSAHFRQRRFVTADERDGAISNVAARGLDTSGREETGWFHCDLFVSRPG